MLSKKYFLLLTILILASQAKIGSSFKINWNGPENPEEQGEPFEGDIVLPALSGRSGTLRAARWSGGTVPYSFEWNYPSSLKKTAMKAMNHINFMTDGCIKFVEKTTQTDFILITFTTSGCYSFVGRQGGIQNVSLPGECWPLRTHVHEIIHAVGFYHQHSRSDRDDYIQIHLENVIPGFEYAFKKYNENEVSDFEVKYDYASAIMTHLRNFPNYCKWVKGAHRRQK